MTHFLKKNFSETLCCDPSTNFDELPQDQFVNCLTDVCRYDRFVLPNKSTPFDVTAKVDINHLEAAQSVSISRKSKFSICGFSNSQPT